MVCVYCNGQTDVKNSRLQKRSNQVWRRRQCKACKAIFTTHEAIDLSSALMVDYNGSTAPFLRERLYSDILTSLKHRSDSFTASAELTNTVINKLLHGNPKPSINSHSITQVTAEVLKRFDNRAWLRYSADHPVRPKFGLQHTDFRIDFEKVE